MPQLDALLRESVDAPMQGLAAALAPGAHGARWPLWRSTSGPGGGSTREGLDDGDAAALMARAVLGA